MNNTKTAFLILRVEESFKIKLVKKAKKSNKSLSEYLRSILENES